MQEGAKFVKQQKRQNNIIKIWKRKMHEDFGGGAAISLPEYVFHANRLKVLLGHIVRKLIGGLDTYIK